MVVLYTWHVCALTAQRQTALRQTSVQTAFPSPGSKEGAAVHAEMQEHAAAQPVELCNVQCINRNLLFVQAQSAEKCAAQLKLARAAAAEAKAAADAALSAAAEASNTAACAAAQAAAQAAADRAAQSGASLGLRVPCSQSPPTLL